MSGQDSIHVLLADDHSLIRQGIALLLEDLGRHFRVSTASTLQQVQDVLSIESADLLIIDIHFPDGNSMRLLPEIVRQHPGTKILVFSGVDEKQNAVKCLNAGASGFLSKLGDEDEIKNAIVRVLDSGSYLSAVAQEMLITSLQSPTAANPLSCLTEKELYIAKMYGRGFGNLEIASALNLKQNTVSTFKKRIFEKLGISNLVQLIQILNENGAAG